MGDGVLTYFGYPQAQQDDAERAVRAGLAVIDARCPSAHTIMPPVRAAWLRPKQTDLVPGKGQLRSRFPQSAQLRLSDNDFWGSPQPTPTSSQRNWTQTRTDR